MPSLVSESDKVELSNLFNDLHDTFFRNIKVIQEADKIVLYQDPNFNGLFNRPVESVEKEYKEFIIEARIHYLTTSNLNDPVFPSRTEGGVSLEQSSNEVRIKIKKEDFHIFKGYKRIEIDGFPFDIISGPRQHGLFTPKFITLYLRKLD